MICQLCKKDKKQLIGEKRNGKYTEGCWDCLFPKKKR